MAENEFPNGKLSRSEQITALSHYYRAEVQRSLAWRERLDRTTNWAVGSTAVFLGYSYSHPEIHHAVFLFSFAIIYTLLLVESRRYRFYDAYEYRVRLMNQHFAYGVLAEGVLADDLELDGKTYWRAEIAADLRYPQYKMDLWQALGRRIYANYFPLFVILLAGWLLKIKLHPVIALSWHDYYQQAGIGNFPAWLTFLCMLLFVVHLIGLMLISRKIPRGQDLLHSRREKK